MLKFRSTWPVWQTLIIAAFYLLIETAWKSFETFELAWPCCVIARKKDCGARYTLNDLHIVFVSSSVLSLVAFLSNLDIYSPFFSVVTPKRWWKYICTFFICTRRPAWMKTCTHLAFSKNDDYEALHWKMSAFMYLCMCVCVSVCVQLPEVWVISIT